MKYFASLALLVCSVSNAQEVVECSKIVNAKERLDCFDRLYPQDGRPTPAPEIETETIPLPESVRPTSVPPPKSAPAVEPLPVSKGRLFGSDPTVNLTSTIKAVRRQDKQKMVFLLENDEIRIQSSPRPLPIRKGDSVTIKNGSVGGYILRTEGGTSTRVSRIK